MGKNSGDIIDLAGDSDTPALIEMVGPGTARTFSFRGVASGANAIARGLLRRRFSRGNATGILAPNSSEYLTCYFGTMRAGLESVFDIDEQRLEDFKDIGPFDSVSPENVRRHDRWPSTFGFSRSTSPCRRAVYYARVFENPRRRTSTWARNAAAREDRAARCDDKGVPKTIQERAWTLPIGYVQ